MFTNEPDENFDFKFIKKIGKGRFGKIYLILNINNNILNDKEYISIIIELLIGLITLHKLNIVHMDIKPKNILIFKKNNNYQIKYIDFGFACEKNNIEYISRYRGTAQYMDPYMIEKKIDTFFKSVKADVWSLGITIYKLVHRELPWENKNKEEIKQEILKIDKIKSKNPLYKPIIN